MSLSGLTHAERRRLIATYGCGDPQWCWDRGYHRLDPRPHLPDPVRRPRARRFRLVRTTDVSGVSGTGTVAEGCVFTNGKAVLAWLPTDRYEGAVNVYVSIADLEAVHGHDGATVIEWMDS